LLIVLVEEREEMIRVSKKEGMTMSFFSKQEQSTSPT
jgi:hypothetical protein